MHLVGLSPDVHDDVEHGSRGVAHTTKSLCDGVPNNYQHMTL